MEKSGNFNQNIKVGKDDVLEVVTPEDNQTKYEGGDGAGEFICLLNIGFYTLPFLKFIFTFLLENIIASY